MTARQVGVGVLLALLGCGNSTDSTDPPAFRARARVGSRGNFVGMFEPASATWTLRLQRPGWVEPEGERTFVFGQPNDLPVVGDWDGDGQQTPGTFRDGLWTLSNVIDGAAALTFRFGAPGDVPVIGDWDGDGVATVGLYRDGSVSIRNSNSEGPVELSMPVGKGVPLVGDWDGDGKDTFGLYAPDTGAFTLFDDYDTTTVELGVRGARPVVGDWDDNRRDTVGVVLGADWTLLNDHRAWTRRDRAPTDYGVNAERYGLGEIALSFGAGDTIPVAGNWVPMANRGFADAGAELREFFPLAADYQWPDSFETWVDAGVNTMVRVRAARDPLPASDDEVERWSTKAKLLGLKMIRQPRESEADPTGVLAWLLYDEPDVQTQDPYEDVATSAARVQGTRPRLINFAGWSMLRQREDIPNVTPKSGPGDRDKEDYYSRYLALQEWASQDTYAISQMFSQQNLHLEDALATLPLAFNKLRRWAPSKPQFAYIETSQHIDLSPLVSPAQFRAQVWLAIAGGMRGIFYFAANDCGRVVNGVRVPQCTLPDGTRPDVRDEMRRQNARITALTHVLQGEINPLSFSVSAAAPLETAWRASEDGKYIIAVNATESAVERWIRIEGATTSAVEVLDENRTLDTVGGYTFKDTIPPLDARVYRFR